MPLSAGAAEGPSSAPPRSLTRIALYTASALALAHVGFVVRYAQDLPFWDDYDAILRPLTAYERDGDLLRLLFAPHNEHVIVWVRLASYLQRQVLGRVSFFGLVCLGELFLLATLLLWTRELARAGTTRTADGAVRDVKHVTLLAVTGAAFFLNTSYWASSLWALASLSNLPVLFFSYAAFVAIDCVRGRRGISLAAVCCLLALASQAGGLFAFFVVAAMLNWQRSRSALVAWLVLSAVAVGGYLALRLGYPNDVALQPRHTSPLQTAGFFLAFLGAQLHQRWLALGLGALLVRLLIRSWRGGSAASQSSAGLAAFLLLCAGAAAVNRGHLGLAEAVSSRYAVCSSLLVLAIMLLHARRLILPARVLLPAALLWNLALFVRAAPHIERYRAANEGLLLGAASCKRVHHHYDTTMAASIYAEASAAGIYRAPDRTRARCPEHPPARGNE